MGIFDKSLRNDETIEYIGKTSPIMVIIYSCLFMLSLVLLAVAFAINQNNKATSIILMVISISLGVISFLNILTRLEYFLTTKIAITNQRLLFKSGLLTTKHIDMPFNHISAVEINETLLGKAFNYATVLIQTSASFTAIKIFGLCNAFEFQNIIKTHMETLQQN